MAQFCILRMEPIIISSANELVRVHPRHIVYISSDGNYTTMVLHNKIEQVFSFNLSRFQELIEQQMKEEAQMFIRIGRGLIINRNYIYKINVNRQQLLLSDQSFNGVFNLTASKEALKQLKQLFDNEINRTDE